MEGATDGRRAESLPEPRARQKIPSIAYPRIRPGGEYTTCTEAGRNNACGHDDRYGATLNLDNRFRSYNFVELMPRLQEHLKR
jgi:hypothetical protein